MIWEFILILQGSFVGFVILLYFARQRIVSDEWSKHRFLVANGVFVLGTILFGLLMTRFPNGGENLLDYLSLLLVFGPILIVSSVFYFRKSMDLFEVWLALGIPVGLAGGNIAVSNSIALISNPEEVGRASSVMLLSALYGAFISACGYFAIGKTRTYVKKTLTVTQVVLIVVGFFTIWILPMMIQSGLYWFFSFELTLLYLCLVAMAVLMNTDKSKSLVHCASDGALAGIILSLVIALVHWFPESPSFEAVAVNFGSLGLVYGTMIYILCYLVSLSTGETEQINFRVKNWHLVEINTFYIFLVFAPVNLGESMFNDLDEIERVKMVQQQESMRSEISMLTERLAKLEGS
jgi:hypothetical protein